MTRKGEGVIEMAEDERGALNPQPGETALNEQSEKPAASTSTATGAPSKVDRAAAEKKEAADN